MKNKYVPTSFGMYLNYMIVGMSIIILPQNMDVLAKQWHTNLAGVSIVISAVGLGRVFVSLVSGILSDKLGRRLFILLGTVLFIGFFLGTLLSRSLIFALIFAICAGIGGAFMDAGTYPALMEMFPKHQSAANVTLKAFVSIGEFALPLVISMLVLQHLWYGWSFVLCLVILVITLTTLFRFGHFPVKTASTERKTAVQTTDLKPKTHLKLIDGVLFTIFAYAIDAVILLVSIWLTKYGQDVIGMTDTGARALVSYYSVGSIVCVLLTIWLSHKGVKDIQFLISYMSIAFVSLLLLYLFPTPILSTVLAFVVGFSSAGGVMQIGLTVMASFSPGNKGVVTGIFTTATSIAGFTANLIAGALTSNIANVMLLNVIFAFISFIAAILITMRYHRLFDSNQDEKLLVADQSKQPS